MSKHREGRQQRQGCGAAGGKGDWCANTEGETQEGLGVVQKQGTCLEFCGPRVDPQQQKGERETSQQSLTEKLLNL